MEEVGTIIPRLRWPSLLCVLSKFKKYLCPPTFRKNFVTKTRFPSLSYVAHEAAETIPATLTAPHTGELQPSPVFSDNRAPFTCIYIPFLQPSPPFSGPLPLFTTNRGGGCDVSKSYNAGAVSAQPSRLRA